MNVVLNLKTQRFLLVALFAFLLSWSVVAITWLLLGTHTFLTELEEMVIFYDLTFIHH